LQLTTIDEETAMELTKTKGIVFLPKNIQISPEVRDIISKNQQINLSFLK
jgi:hypothetical protein